MIYIQDNFDRWYRKIDMYPYKNKCFKCKQEVDVFRPVLAKDLHGLCSDAHECGEQYRIYYLRPLGEKQRMLQDAFNGKFPDDWDKE